MQLINEKEFLTLANLESLNDLREPVQEDEFFKVYKIDTDHSTLTASNDYIKESWTFIMSEKIHKSI